MIHENTNAGTNATDKTRLQELIIAAGFGGQGIVFMAKVLGYAGLR